MVCAYCFRKKYVSRSKKYQGYTWFVHTVSEKNMFQDPKSIKDKVINIVCVYCVRKKYVSISIKYKGYS